MTFSISSSYTKIRSLVEVAPNDPLPPLSSITRAADSLPPSLPWEGLGEELTEAHLLRDITPGLNGPKTSANYYGFVTGGVFPIAEVADHIVTAFDQNMMVHLPEQTVSTVVEDRALSMLVELLDLGSGWEGRTFTTGATAANILGMACGREFMLGKRLRAAGISEGVGDLGLLGACLRAGVKEIQVVTTMGHSSLYKAASVVGLGRSSVKDIPVSAEEPWAMDVELLERELQREKDGILSIVALSAGEVNTGKYATDGLEKMRKIRDLCDKYGAWLHVDGAFGIFARALPQSVEFRALIKATAGLELADSITGDGHKMLNVPYDCGFFLTRSAAMLPTIFQNPNAAYISGGGSDIPSPLNIGLENSRRFRALPVYAVLLAYGRQGMAEMFARQVRLARGISAFLDAHDAYDVLAQRQNMDGTAIPFEDTHIIVLFRARDETTNEQLVKRINATRKIYVSGTQWGGRAACRFAISTWRVDVERDIKVIRDVLTEVLVRSD